MKILGESFVSKPKPTKEFSNLLDTILAKYPEEDLTFKGTPQADLVELLHKDEIPLAWKAVKKATHWSKENKEWLDGNVELFGFENDSVDQK